jgi:hypothetical protein
MEQIITLTFTASKSFLKDLKANNIPFYSNTLTSYIVQDSPKVKMAIQMVKERFGSNSITVKPLNS